MLRLPRLRARQSSTGTRPPEIQRSPSECAAELVAAQRALGEVEQEYQRKVDHLQGQVARLESALASVIAASDEVLGDLHEHQVEVQRLAATANPFAAAWGDLDEERVPLEFAGVDSVSSSRYDAAREDFFGLTHVDLQARKWLLN